MSEPVSNAEIEDVLSSIRRLVSSDAEASHEDVAAEPDTPEASGKLILTADFRVVGPSDEPKDYDETDTQDAPEVSDEAVIEFHHAESPPETEADVAVEDSSEAEIEVELAEDDTSEGVWNGAQEQAESVDEPKNTTSALEGTIAELEAAIGQQEGEWEPDGSGFEEDAEAEEVMSEPVQDWIDGTAEELNAQAVADVEEDDTDEDQDLFGTQESVIDEETLRDMVSDIVRQELQGALGERITRNVRKLVRREINRVLASQDFE